MYVLDTNTVIYFFKGMGRVGERLLATPPTEVSLPAVVLYELEVGIAKSSSSKRRRAQLDQFLRTISILPFAREQARAAAEIRSRLERLGTPIGPLDTLIAGTTLQAGATLVTRNVEEFGRVPNLSTENWY
ncbi:MAG: type II toxin-antitoxin system VapC family toxin [Acidobacteria bacterium]|nr:MAG: type II toxin-antitoxin system VapC family toxin [Acidobacteriota bacterium]